MTSEVKGSRFEMLLRCFLSVKDHPNTSECVPTLASMIEYADKDRYTKHSFELEFSKRQSEFENHFEKGVIPWMTKRRCLTQIHQQSRPISPLCRALSSGWLKTVAPARHGAS